MDFTSPCCPERIELEHCTYNLISTLSVRTEQLMMLVGQNHAEFVETKASCSELRLQILGSRERLRAHRVAHGC